MIINGGIQAQDIPHTFLSKEIENRKLSLFDKINTDSRKPIIGQNKDVQKINIHTKPYLKEGWICRIEDQIQAQSKVNIHFRIGGKAYVDYLEGKTNNQR